MRSFCPFPGLRPGVLALLLAAPALPADLCQGLPTDKLPRSQPARAKPAVGTSYVDPQFGSVVRRLTASGPVAGHDAATVPLYSTISAWNADESRLLLYHVGRGHELYDGRSYAFIRLLDIAPNDVEQVYWHVSDPNVLLYLSGKSLLRYRVATAAKETVRTFSTCTGPLGAGDDPMFTSWDSDAIGLKCGSTAFVYRISTNTITGTMSTAFDPPKVAPSGERALQDGYVLNLALQTERRLDLGNPYDHGSLGRLANGRDVWNAVAFDPGPLGSGVGLVVSHDLQNGAAKVIIGPATGWPYPPTGAHVSSLAYKAPGWVFASTEGQTPGQTALHREIVLADVNTGRACRVAHHRSAGSSNQRLRQPYWAEPHVVPSPSGTRAIFASDWGGGASVDTYVVELPADLGLGLGVSVASPTYRTGGVVQVTFSAVNRGGRSTLVDLIAFELLPDGDQAVVLTATGARAGRLSKPSTLTGLLGGLDLVTPFNASTPFTARVFSGSEPSGTYYWVFAAVRPSSLADNRIDPGDVLATGVASYAFSP